jgi:hypothetical protein
MPVILDDRHFYFKTIDLNYSAQTEQKSVYYFYLSGGTPPCCVKSFELNAIRYLSSRIEFEPKRQTLAWGYSLSIDNRKNP